MSFTVHHDHSATFGPIRNQGKRPTCVAFAMSDLSRYYSNSSVLSAEYLYQSAANLTPGWKPGDGTYISHAVAATATPGLPDDAFFPYQPGEPLLPLQKLPVPTPPALLYSSTFADGPISGAAYVKAQLAAGHPVGLVIKLTTDFYKPNAGIVAYSPMVVPKQRHAIVATGYGTHNVSSEPYILIRNSWGTAWGDKGYAWIHETYIDSHTVNAFRI
jgi:hypothetical protein